MSKLIQPTFQQMRLFESVARHGSMTRAAEEVNLTQPSVSMQLKTLEEKIGTPLLDQQGRKLTPTRAGEELLAASRDILSRLSEMESALDNLNRQIAGPISVATVSSAKYFLPQVLGHFKRRFPGVEPRLQITNRETLLARIAENADDLYIMGRFPREEDVIAEPFLENVIVFVARPDHPLAGVKNIPLSRITDQDLILREQGSGTRLAVDRMCADHGVTLTPHLEFDDAEAIKQGVISGLGIAYLSLHSLRLELASGELALLNVEGFPLRRQWYALRRKGKRLNKVAKAFMDFLQDDTIRGVSLPPK